MAAAAAPGKAPSGSPLLAVELPPPPEPPASEIPEEYHVYDLAGSRRSQPIIGTKCLFPSTRPSNRSEVQHLARCLEGMLAEAGSSTLGALRAWDLVCGELVRQVFVHCAERGELLGRVRRAHRHYVGALVRRVREMEGTAREVRLRELEAEVTELRGKLGESRSAATRSRVLGRMQAAVAQERGGRAAIAEAEKARGSKEGGAKTEACLSAYKECTPPEQQQLWRDMLGGAAPKARAQALHVLWKLIPEGRRADLLTQLCAELGTPLLCSFLLTAAAPLPFESRLSVVEGLLRDFSSFETLTLVEFLPYVW